SPSPSSKARRQRARDLSETSRARPRGPPALWEMCPSRQRDELVLPGPSRSLRRGARWLPEASRAPPLATSCLPGSSTRSARRTPGLRGTAGLPRKSSPLVRPASQTHLRSWVAHPVTSIHLLEPLLSQGNQSRPLLAIRQLHFHTRARLRITTRLPLSCATAEHCTIAERHRDITPAPETRYRSWEEGPSPPQRPPVWTAATRRDFVLAACRFLKQWRDALHRARESSARRARSPSDVAPRLRRHDENQGQRGASTGVVDWSRRLESSTGVVDWSRRRGRRLESSTGGVEQASPCALIAQAR